MDRGMPQRSDRGEDGRFGSLAELDGLGRDRALERFAALRRISRTESRYARRPRARLCRSGPRDGGASGTAAMG